MIYVFLAGILGFLVFDAYRIYQTYSKARRLEFSFSTLLGICIHLFVYLACGTLGVFVNLDVMGICCDWALYPEFKNEIVGPALRSFALGLAGPAGISKGQTSLSTEMQPSAKDFGDMTVRPTFTSNVALYLRILFMR
ncbi:hypothetical protein [Rhabdochromatium marinum]|uniref:hypothetical protein n=1 Tax=Rhabdochromatium marinum TaxID=48729 RepID=UPI0019046681|nr:hypothetical protein [Rhabdochromatium marinum]